MLGELDRAGGQELKMSSTIPEKKKKILIFSVALKFYSSTSRGPLAIFTWGTFTMVKGDDYKMVGEGDDGDAKQDHSKLECWPVAPYHQDNQINHSPFSIWWSPEAKIDRKSVV